MAELKAEFDSAKIHIKADFQRKANQLGDRIAEKQRTIDELHRLREEMELKQMPDTLKLRELNKWYADQIEIIKKSHKDD